MSKIFSCVLVNCVMLFWKPKNILKNNILDHKSFNIDFLEPFAQKIILKNFQGIFK